MSDRKSKIIFGIIVKNTTRHAHQDLCLKFAVDQCYLNFPE